jgi:hypothetical protein
LSARSCWASAAFDHGRHQWLGLGGQFAQRLHPLHQDAHQALAFAGAGLLEPLGGALGGVDHRVVELDGVAALAAPVQRLVHAQGAGLRQPAGDLGFEPGQAVELVGLGLRPRGVGLARGGHAHLDLAAAQRAGEQLAQGRFQATQLVRHAERQVQKAAVDAAQLDGDVGAGRTRTWGGRGRGA